ncbi:MAG: hypothetical protein EHM58_14330 [Ignavibacteriae bacterium]|nr:MAG: hypothetical protein EHM58_14330 [Ignavibacteriota bacterium]
MNIKIILISLLILSCFSISGSDNHKSSTYTLSPVSVKVLQMIDSKIKVNVYYTDNLPSPYNTNRASLVTLLNEYKINSNGKFDYEILNPTDGSSFEFEANKYNISQVQVQVIKNDIAMAVKAYMGVVFFYENKEHVLPFISGGEPNLEYEFTLTIKKLIQSELKKIGILGGTPGIPDMNKYTKLIQANSKYYDFSLINPSDNKIPDDISVTIVLNQETNDKISVIPENHKAAIDDYLMNGGKIIFLLNKIIISSKGQVQQAQSTNCGIEDILENYGVKVLNNIIIDKECAYISVPFQQGETQFYTQIPFPHFPKIIDLNKNIPAFSGLSHVILSFSSSLDISNSSNYGINAIPILTSSLKTGIDNDISIIQTSGKMLPDSMFNSSSAVIGALLEGEFKSFYKGSIKEKSSDTKISVIMNNDFINDDFRGPDENIVFLQS